MTTRQHEAAPEAVPLTQQASPLPNLTVAPPPMMHTSGSQPQSPVQLRQVMLSPVLRNALFSVKDRSFIISLEQDLMNFIASHTDSYLLRPMNSYYRLLTHQTAEYHGLGHTLNNERNSIVVFKNFGTDVVPPMPLASIPFDAQLAALQQQQQQQLIYQQQGVHGPPPMYGYPPMGFPQGISYGQQTYNKNYGGRYRNNRRSGDKSQQGQQGVQQESASEKETKGSNESIPSPAATQFKLMKRTVSKPETTDSAQEDLKDADREGNDSTPTLSEKESEDLEDERATRESEYQKARERIFENGEDEVDEDLINMMNNMTYNPRPAVPRSLPTPPMQPYQGYVSPQMASGVTPQFYYNAQGFPQMMYDPSYNPQQHQQQQQMYYGQMYGGGYRKKPYQNNGYKNNGYKNNRSYNNGYGNYGQYNNARQQENEAEGGDNTSHEDVSGKSEEVIEAKTDENTVERPDETKENQ